MNIKVKVLFASVIIALSFLPCIAQQAPVPYGLTPSGRQLEWYDREMIAFFHFGINTFEEYVNEGDGKASTAIFNPTALDCRQWMQTLKRLCQNAGTTFFYAQSPDFHKPGLCYYPKFLYL
ncbi:hypothetical protein [Bacteroides faecis]|uniref:hypothetical protein n=1 Tax=Bacteroides faecis TaxID=674529 RepID=UPI0039C30030